MKSIITGDIINSRLAESPKYLQVILRRYLKESKDRKLTEYILIGTLISFGIAIFTGLATMYLLS